jgi:hypothetical protein
MPRIFCLFSVLLFAASFDCAAQINVPARGDSTSYWRVETNDGNEFFGKIIVIEAGVMTLKTDKFGTITVRMTDVKSIQQADTKKVNEGEYWDENFQSTRYFWMPNGYGLKPGEAYYQNVWILFNQFNVGITKNFSIAAGTIPLFLFGADAFPLWINAKVSVPLGEKAHFGGGVLYLTLLDFTGDASGEDGGAGVAYGVMTFGTRDRNASLGVGYGFTAGNFSQRPVITFATMTRLGRHSYLMTENYLFGVGGGNGDGDAFGLLSIGGRRLIKRTGLDFGGFIPVAGGLDRLVIIPWLGLSVPLSKPRSAD